MVDYASKRIVFTMNFVNASLNGKIILYRYFFLSVLLYFRPRIGHLFDLWRVVIDRSYVHGLYLGFRGTDAMTYTKTLLNLS